ncbi:unnamed protein product [Ascophyllum nodosum]
MPSETTTACVRLLVFFRIRHGTFPYGIEDDASTISQTPTTHYTNTPERRFPAPTWRCQCLPLRPLQPSRKPRSAPTVEET